MGILNSITGLFRRETPESRELRKAKQILAKEKAQLETIQIRRQRQLIDTPETVAYPQSDWFAPFFDRMSELQTDPNFFPFSNTTARKHGNNWPLFQNDQQLDVYRMLSRNVYDTNSHGKGLLTGIKNYVVHKGFTIRATAKDTKHADDPTTVALVDAVQNWLDDFLELNEFDELQQESFIRSKRDGEYFWRHFPQDNGQTILRFVWPEHIRTPRGYESEWTYGIRCKEKDNESPLEYAVLDADEPNHDPELVGADEIDHVKCNVDRGIKRGMPELCLDMRDILESSRRLRRNMAEGAAIQAAIAYIRQHASATSTQISDFVAGQRDYKRPRVTMDGERERDTEIFESGTILDVDAGQTFVAPPGATNIPGYVAVVQACLRAAGARWNAPEGLASGDYSNNNMASALVAEAPFRRGCETEQTFYGRRFKRTIRKALKHAVDLGKLPRDVLQAVALQIEGPSLEVRNKMEEAQTNQIYSAMGIKSLQTISQQLDLDYENEQSNIEAARSKAGPEGSALPLPGEGGDNEQQSFGFEQFVREQFAFENFTGVKTFSDGSKHHYVDGVQVSGGEHTEAPPAPDLPDGLPEGTDKAKAQGVLSRMWDSVSAKAIDLSARLGTLAPDILDTAADYSKISYASHGSSALGSVDPFATHLGISSNAVAVVASHVLSKASLYLRKKLGMTESDVMTLEERAAAIAEVLTELHTSLGVDVAAPDETAILEWLQSRQADLPNATPTA